MELSARQRQGLQKIHSGIDGGTALVAGGFFLATEQLGKIGQGSDVEIIDIVTGNPLISLSAGESLGALAMIAGGALIASRLSDLRDARSQTRKGSDE